MNQKELTDVKEKFLTSLDKKETPIEKFKLCERFYNYINKFINEGDWDKPMTNAKLWKEKFDVLSLAVEIIVNNLIKAKELTETWNSQVTGKVLEFVKNEKASASAQGDVNEMVVLIDKIVDFPTKVYCYSLLDELPKFNLRKFGNAFIEAQREADRKEKLLKEIESFNYRLCRAGSLHREPIGQLYYNHQTKEHMTFDECVEQGLSVAWLGRTKHVEGKPYPEYSQDAELQQFVDEGDEESMAIALENAERKRKSLERLIEKADSMNVNYDTFISKLEAYDKVLSKYKDYKPSQQPLKNPEVELKVLQDIARSIVIDEKMLEEETAETTLV